MCRADGPAASRPAHPSAPPPTPEQVLPTQLVPDEEEGKILRVRLIQKEGKEMFDPTYLFDEGSTVSWIPCGRKLTCSFPGGCEEGGALWHARLAPGRQAGKGMCVLFSITLRGHQGQFHRPHLLAPAPSTDPPPTPPHPPPSPGIKLFYGPDTYYGEEVSVLEMDGQFDKLEELIYMESHLSNTSSKFYGEITQQASRAAAGGSLVAAVVGGVGWGPGSGGGWVGQRHQWADGGLWWGHGATRRPACMNVCICAPLPVAIGRSRLISHPVLPQQHMLTPSPAPAPVPCRCSRTLASPAPPMALASSRPSSASRSARSTRGEGRRKGERRGSCQRSLMVKQAGPRRGGQGWLQMGPPALRFMLETGDNQPVSLPLAWLPLCRLTQKEVVPV